MCTEMLKTFYALDSMKRTTLVTFVHIAALCPRCLPYLLVKQWQFRRTVEV